MSLSAERQAEVERASAWTLEDLERAMAEVDPAIRERLAHGPLVPRYACGVCQAFRGIDTAALDPDSPAFLVFNYHEAPKAEMRTPEDQWYGPLANAVYRRCVETYRAAGWRGEPEGANA